MIDTQAPPYDAEAERVVLGSMIWWPPCLEIACCEVTVEDFYVPAHGEVFGLIHQMWLAGDPVDEHRVAKKLERAGTSTAREAAQLVLQLGFASVVSPEVCRAYCRDLRADSARRRLMHAASEMTVDARLSGDPAETIGRTTEALNAITRDLAAYEPAVSMDDFLDRPPRAWEQWMIPGVIRGDWRIVVVAQPSMGKTTLLMQLAWCASQGVHPFTGKRIPPQRVLLVDCENPPYRIEQGARLIRPYLRTVVGDDDYDRKRLAVLHQQEGLNLRTGAGRAVLENAIARHRPNLVCAGPLYKMTRRKPTEGWDEVAEVTQEVLDRYRVRYRFGLILEDHPPRGGELRPFGSSMWDRWPDMGPTLERAKDDKATPPARVVVGRWRGDRVVEHSWPDELHRGGAGELPWTGYWANGIPDDDGMF